MNVFTPCLIFSVWFSPSTIQIRFVSSINTVSRTSIHHYSHFSLIFAACNSWKTSLHLLPSMIYLRVSCPGKVIRFVFHVFRIYSFVFNFYSISFYKVASLRHCARSTLESFYKLCETPANTAFTMSLTEEMTRHTWFIHQSTVQGTSPVQLRLRDRDANTYRRFLWSVCICTCKSP